MQVLAMHGPANFRRMADCNDVPSASVVRWLANNLKVALAVVVAVELNHQLS